MVSGSITSKRTIKDIFKVASSNILKLAAGVLVGFLLPKIIGVTDYGYYKTFTLYATYAGLFHFGFADGIYLKYGGKTYDELDKSSFRIYSRFLIILEIIIGVVGVLLALITMRGETQFIFFCLVIYLFSFNVANYYQLISQITGRFSELSYRNSIYSVLTVLSILSLWVFHKWFCVKVTYRVYTILYVIIAFVLCIWYLTTYRDITFGSTNKNFQIKRDVIEIIKIGIPLMVANMSSSLIMSLDRQFVNILYDTDTYAVYAFAYNMLTLITTAMAAVSTVLYPTLKRTDEKTLKESYSKLIRTITIIVYLCISVYFPLSWFVTWFLPKYVSSLVIFRVILPGLSVSSAVTIIMHNYYKATGKSFQYFVKSMIVLFLSALANYTAYRIVGTTIAISIASILVMVIWYIFVEIYFIKTYKVKWFRNLLYIFVMGAGFYSITVLNNWIIGLFIYLLFLCIVTFLFFKRDVLNILKLRK